MTFSDFLFEPELNEGLISMGFEKPTPIQEQAIPKIIKGHDLVACAQTGTGKTAAYLLPVINNIVINGTNNLHTLIIVPTRELAIQIDEAVQGLTYFASLSSIAIYGGNNGSSIAIYGGNNGTSFDQERKALVHGAQIIIATPGRLISHLSQGYVKMDSLQTLILDEADRMLDMGFYDDINRIISFIPSERQTLLFSATMPSRIRTLASKILRNPEQINIAVSKPAEGVEHGAYVVYETQKVELLKSYITEGQTSNTIVFASTKEKVKLLERELLRNNFKVAAIHSDLEQAERNDVMRQFKSHKINALIATDILSRGIDIDSIGMVINYDVPGDAEDYIHRVGRTARAEAKGKAITFVSVEDQRKFKRIEDFLGYEITKLQPPASIGEVPAYNPKATEKHGRHSSGKRHFRKPKKK